MRLLSLFIAFFLLTPSTFAFIHSDESIIDPVKEFTLENINLYEYEEQYSGDPLTLEGQTIFTLAKMRKLRRDKFITWENLDGRFDWDFPVVIYYDDPEHLPADPQNIASVDCMWSKATGVKSCDILIRKMRIVRMDKALAHEVQHIIDIAKRGKSTVQSSKLHPLRLEEQTTLVNDKLRLLELKMRVGFSYPEIMNGLNNLIKIKEFLLTDEDDKVDIKILEQWKKVERIFKNTYGTGA
jgi:hypothetical protein